MTLDTITSCTLLLVDDEEANLDLLEALLRPEGYENLVRTSDARAAISLFDASSPDLVLLDLHMPYTSGFDVLREIRQHTRAGDFIPVLVLTADVSPEARIQALSGGAHDFLTKPLDAIEVCLRVRNLLETRLLHRQARAATLARDRVLSIVAHDLRNPLTAIAANAEMLRELLPPDASAHYQRRIAQIEHAAQRMDRMVEDLLEIARLEQGILALQRTDLSVADFFDALCAMLRPLADARSIQLTFSGPRAVPGIRADGARLVQVLSNLVSNALKFTPEGGTVAVSWRIESGELVVAVADTGAGIPAEQASRLFDAFWQAEASDRRGVGLGLAIARAIVEAHGGRIWLDTHTEAGATFCFAIPFGGDHEHQQAVGVHMDLNRKHA